jgi:hypothetical protein
MTEKNEFGGGNPHSLYVPMSDDEQEVLLRLVESQTLQVVIHPWGLVCIPTSVGVGDKRLAVQFRMAFTMPVPETAVTSIDLELTAFGGFSLFRKPYSTKMPDGTPLIITEGLTLDLQWDIAIDHMDPKLVKALKPRTLGLTTRRLDSVTGERTLSGNMKLSDKKKRTLQIVEAGEQRVRKMDAEEIRKLRGR